MRRRFFTLATVIALSSTSCSDTAPTGTGMAAYTRGLAGLTLTETIQQQINDFLPKGFEDAVGARWSTVRDKKLGGDFAGAVKHLNTLTTWVDKKTADITPPTGMTRAQAAAILITNMARWVYEGDAAAPAAIPTGDVVVEVVPAGTAVTLQTPSQHAGVTWGAGSTSEDRVVVLSVDPAEFPGHCNGPLPTARCQYPLFYRLESYPKLRLNTPGRIAVCLVTTGDRRPLEYPADEDADGPRPVDDRIRVAHNKPANPADYTPGATQEDGIEILPLSGTNSGTLINCNAPSTASMNRLERVLYAASEFAARFLSPQNAWAYDAGPEHDFSYFSNFNAVDPASQPDLSIESLDAPASGDVGTSVTATFSVANTSRRSGGDATAQAAATTATLWLSSDATVDESDTQVGTTPVPLLRPDQSQAVSFTFNLPATGGSYQLIAVVAPNDTYTTETSTANNSARRGITAINPEVPLALNLTTVEKLPNGTQTFTVTSGSPGPYVWSVNGTDGGNATYGTIVATTGASADYTAPASVPTPATFDVCARRAASPSNRACASVTIKPIPSSGADVVVFNDLNMFDNTAAADPNNLVLYRNLVTYTGTGPRASMTRVWVHRGHSVRCNQPTGNKECSPSGWSTFESTMRTAGSGFTVDDVDDTSGPLTSIPADVKVIILALPMTNYSTAEINSMKAFAGDGGRLIFVGEHQSFYGAGISVENDFLTKMGAVMRNTGGSIDCNYNIIPGSSLRPHQITTGVAQIKMACASVVAPGPNDYALFYDKAGTRLLGAVAKVDLTPLAATVATNGMSSTSSSSNTTDSTNAGMIAVSWGWMTPP